MNTLKIFLWAAMHSDEFRHCYIKPLLSLRFRRWNWASNPVVWRYEIEIQLRRSLDIYIPFAVQDAYRLSQGDRPEFDYDEIPF